MRGIEIKVESADPYSPEGRLLVERLWEEECVRYGDSGPCEFQPSDISGDGCAFVIAWQGGQPVGCGAIRPFVPETTGVGEVKRIFVEPAARRQGIARRILNELEETAVHFGYTILRLETGTLQPEAVRLYETSGYYRIAPYGPYADHPLCVCFEKKLNF